MLCEILKLLLPLLSMLVIYRNYVSKIIFYIIAFDYIIYFIIIFYFYLKIINDVDYFQKEYTI